MNLVSRRVRGRLIAEATRSAVSNVLKRLHRQVAMRLPTPPMRQALKAATRAFAPFEPTGGTRQHALRESAFYATQLIRHRRLDGELFDALLAAARQASEGFRPAALQSYVDVSVLAAAILAFTEFTAEQLDIDTETLFAALAAHAPTDRALLLAHAELLLDRGRRSEAEALARRALRMQAVCQIAQRLLARATEGDYDLRGRFCKMPFTQLSTSYRADAFACTCPAWLPYPVGNVIDGPSAESVWNSSTAQEIRRSIHDGDFSYCSRTLCSYITARSLPTKEEVEDPILRRYIEDRTVVVTRPPDMVQMNHDPSCNLACPSCRTAVITAGPAEQRVYVDAAERVLLPLLRDMEGQIYISGGGEVFASAHYKKIIAALNRREFPGLDVYLITNGQLLNAKRWAEFPDLPEMIGILSVSIDAARAETYEQLRRPGKWTVLMQNLETMSRMRAEGAIRCLQLNFVVQGANFREIPEFVAMAADLGADDIWLQRLTNYGSFGETAFEAADVTSPAHPEHEDLLAILRRFVDEPRVNMEMLLPLLPEVVTAGAANPALIGRQPPSMAGKQGRPSPALA